MSPVPAGQPPPGGPITMLVTSQLQSGWNAWEGIRALAVGMDRLRAELLTAKPGGAGEVNTQAARRQALEGFVDTLGRALLGSQFESCGLEGNKLTVLRNFGGERPGAVTVELPPGILDLLG